MPSTFFFNPENDLALAVGSPRFTPPKGALAVRRAGRLLPLFWAGADDEVLVDSLDCAEEAERLKSRFGLDGHIVTTAQPYNVPEPWGWSLYTRNLFADSGIDASMLPDDTTLETLRQLSHRRTSIDINRDLGIDSDLLPVEAATLEDARKAIGHWGKAVIKLPWSSSGRGVIYSFASPEETLHGYLRGMIRRQGSVILEPYRDRIQDFAMLFYSDGTTARFRGLSMFITDGRGFYSGNLVMRQEDMSGRLPFDHRIWASRLEHSLTKIIAPAYRGWMGVDMMTCRGLDGNMEVVPCVEINLRKTMGVAALFAAQRISTPGSVHRLSTGPDGIEIERLPDAYTLPSMP